MRVFHEGDEVRLPQCAAVIGYFDGVHLGHQDLIRQLRSAAAERRLPTLVITFSDHPRRILQADYQPAALNTTDEKVALLAQCGPDYCYILRFTREMAAMPSADFMESVLARRLNVRLLVIGYDNHFGSDTQNGFEQYRQYGEPLGIEVKQAAPFLLDGRAVSSSAIRLSLQAGDVAEAARMLGRPYRVESTIVHGRHLGSKIGFPTANLDITGLHKLIPSDGCYATRVTADGRAYAGMTYIGRRPTIGAENARTMEVNILDFDRQIYGDHLTVDFIARLRGEKRFASLDALTDQLQLDLQKTRTLVTL